MSRIHPVRDTQSVDLSSADFTAPAGFNNIYVGSAGTLIVTRRDGGTQTYTNIAAGMFHPIQGIGIVKSGTTAGGLVVGIS